jgi:hypothetical protein
LNCRVLRLAYCLAQLGDRELHVLQVRPMREERMPRHRAGVVDSPCRQSLREGCSRGRGCLDSGLAGQVPIRRAIHFYYLKGEAASLTCQLAFDRQVDVVVMGTSYRPETRASVLGNPTERVLHQVHRSVLSVKSERFLSQVTA